MPATANIYYFILVKQMKNSTKTLLIDVVKYNSYSHFLVE